LVQIPTATGKTILSPFLQRKDDFKQNQNLHFLQVAPSSSLKWKRKPKSVLLKADIIDLSLGLCWTDLLDLSVDSGLRRGGAKTPAESVLLF